MRAVIIITTSTGSLPALRYFEGLLLDDVVDWHFWVDGNPSSLWVKYCLVCPETFSITREQGLIGPNSRRSSPIEDTGKED